MKTKKRLKELQFQVHQLKKMVRKLQEQCTPRTMDINEKFPGDVEVDKPMAGERM